MANTAKKKTELTQEEKLEQALVPEKEQPYKVPENWCWTKLTNLITTSKKKTEDFSNPSIKYIGLENMEKDSGIGSYGSVDGVKSLKNVFGEGQILYGKLRPYLNKHDVATFNGVCSTDILVFDPKETTISKYVNYFFDQQSFIEYTVSNSKGINLPRVSESVVLDCLCPLPPYAEQQRIVDRIGSLFAKLDEAKEKAQAVVDGFEDRKAAILHKAFSGELTGEWRKTVGRSISEWRTVTVGDISVVKGGKRVPKGMSLTDIDTGHPYIKAGNLKQGTVIENGISYVPDEVLPYIKNYTVNAGDVYITNVGACIGDCGVIPSQFDGANLTENAVKMTNLQCKSEYLAYYLSSSRVQQLIKTLIASATLGKLSIANIKTIPVFLPSNEEQIKIIGAINKLLEKEKQAMETAEQVIDQIDTMKKSILARAFRGELGTYDPNDEPAAELLKRIL